jgi:hypothetical protein
MGGTIILKPRRGSPQYGHGLEDHQGFRTVMYSPPAKSLSSASRRFPLVNVP